MDLYTKMENVSDSNGIHREVKMELIQSQFGVYLAVCLMALIIFIGSIGNVMVILAVHTTRKLQTVSNAFVVNLSVCDLLFVIMVLPFNIYTYLIDTWNLPPLLCKFVGFLGYTLTGTTIVTITLIAWNRYKLIVDCQNYRNVFAPPKIAMMITAAWLLPMISLIPAVLELWGKFGYVPMMVTCNLHLDHDSQSFKLFLLIVRAAIPCSLITYFYISIYRTTKASHLRVRQGKLLTTLSNQLDLQIHRKEMHLTKMMVTIFVVFALSYFPCTISSIVDWNTVLSKKFHMFCLITVYVGSAVNPLVYGLMNSQFRNAYITLLLCGYCCCFQKRKSDNSRSTHSPAMVRNLLRHKETDKLDENSMAASDDCYCSSSVSSPEQGSRESHTLHRTETERTYVSSEDTNDDAEPVNV